jgi:hypothetical protein
MGQEHSQSGEMASALLLVVCMTEWLIVVEQGQVVQMDG